MAGVFGSASRVVCWVNDGTSSIANENGEHGGEMENLGLDIAEDEIWCEMERLESEIDELEGDMALM